MVALVVVFGLLSVWLLVMWLQARRMDVQGRLARAVARQLRTQYARSLMPTDLVVEAWQVSADENGDLTLHVTLVSRGRERWPAVMAEPDVNQKGVR